MDGQRARADDRVRPGIVEGVTHVHQQNAIAIDDMAATAVTDISFARVRILFLCDRTIDRRDASNRSSDPENNHINPHATMRVRDLRLIQDVSVMKSGVARRYPLRPYMRLSQIETL